MKITLNSYRLGKRHEELHLGCFPQYVDLSEGTLTERAQKTVKAIKEGVAVIYQGVLNSGHEFNGRQYEILGEPDFLIRQGEGYIIRGSKVSRRISEKDHPEILRQLEIYGWLYERTTGRTPTNLQVHALKRG